jgi:hypothetical protein
MVNQLIGVPQEVKGILGEIQDTLATTEAIEESR